MMDCSTFWSSRTSRFETSPSCSTSSSNLDAAENRFAIYHQLKIFRIEADQGLHMNLDGEPMRLANF